MHNNLPKIQSNIVIALLARDCAKSLTRNIPKVENLRTYFSSSYIVAVENDSKDATKDILRKWASSSDGIHLIIKDYGIQTIPNVSKKNPHPVTSEHRIKNMVKYRNMYMNFIRSQKIQPDFLVVIDIDIEDFSVEGIINAIKEAPADWGGIFAFGLKYFMIGNVKLKSFMYDKYAYMYEDVDVFSKEYIYKWERIVMKRVNTEIYSSCISAFGGIGIYKWNLIRDSSYIVRENADPCIKALCEHVPFNKNIILQGYHNYIYKYLVVDYGKASMRSFIKMIIPENLFNYCRLLLNK